MLTFRALALRSDERLTLESPPTQHQFSLETIPTILHIKIGSFECMWLLLLSGYMNHYATDEFPKQKQRSGNIGSSSHSIVTLTRHDDIVATPPWRQ